MTSAADLLTARRHVLLDFDGPVCAVFSGLSAASVAREMLALLHWRKVSVPNEFASGGPHSIFYVAAATHPEIADELNALLTRLEVEAVKSAEPTPATSDLLRAWHTDGRGVAVVSNNAGEAVRAYLQAAGLAGLRLPVFGRPSDPNLMKPDPHLLQLAMRRLDSDVNSTVMIGDSTTDIEAAAGAGVPVIAYANKPGKAARFASEGADAIIHDMAELASARVGR